MGETGGEGRRRLVVATGGSMLPRVRKFPGFVVLWAVTVRARGGGSWGEGGGRCMGGWK